ncbi:PREDICTED: UDP-N-acetylglucosamine/UDP-glucose/GDP-mannose transporter [Populus euphratica]|uniref:UDP-N-acetylglucosamine/UDP-glucose/GDP-mannose transporter n=1 Tax=Populus euphratica TaxID=75702 RepID=A0AAJ6V163_POPEU|nr:PREDICTED: UDP-N-acetylglucosamine/UDP-glucose/GDP-mannose transporter [Populus euphratica]
MSSMASSSSSNSILPVSVSPLDEERQREKERLIKGDEKAFRGSSMTKRGAYAAISYMSCAVLLVLFNKAALSSYNFPSANVITLFQMICSCSFLYALRRWRIISFTDGGSLTTSDANTTFLPLETFMRTLPLALTYLFYMLVTMESVRGVNVPMYTTLRRTTVVFTMITEYILAGQRYTRPIFGSVGLIVLGAFIAGARDLSFDFYGYAVVFAANFTTAIYLATISRIGKSSGLNSFGLMWCNGIICGPVLLFWTFIRGDLGMTTNFPYLFSPGFLAVLLLSCILAFFLNYSIFLNTTLNSALTQTICGNLKDLFTIALGWTIFGGLPFDFFNVIGQCLGFAGSGLYAYYKLIGR